MLEEYFGSSQRAVSEQFLTRTGQLAVIGFLVTALGAILLTFPH